MTFGQTPALTKGAEQPSKITEGIRLYSGRFCPFAHRIRLALNSKNIPYEIINIDLREKPEWYQEISPLGKVPLLEEPGGRRIAESQIIAEYVDDVIQNGRKLLPTDPRERAQQKMLTEMIATKITGPHQQTILKGEPENKEALLTALDDIEKLLTTTYFAGEEIGFVDLMVWPWFERLPAIEEHRGMAFLPDRYPRISHWIKHMRNDPAVQKSGHSTELYTQFYKTRNASVGI